MEDLENVARALMEQLGRDATVRVARSDDGTPGLHADIYVHGESLVLDALAAAPNLLALRLRGHASSWDLTALTAFKGLNKLVLVDERGTLGELQRRNTDAHRSHWQTAPFFPHERTQHVAGMPGLRPQLTPDLTPLGSLSGLRSLKLQGLDTFEDLTPIARLIDLTELEINEASGIWDISPLAALRKLERLQLRFHGVGDLGPLAELSGLRELDLGLGHELSDISALGGLPRLTRLDLTHALFLGDIEALRGVRTLRSICLDHCKDVDLSPLQELPLLEEVWMRHCPEKTFVWPLAACKSLKRVNLHNSGHIRDLDSLAACPSLTELHWTEDAATHAVLVSTAVLRGDVETIAKQLREWLRSVRLVRDPDAFGRRVLDALALGAGEAWSLNGYDDLALQFRMRARADGQAEVIAPSTWTRWAAAVVHLPEVALAPLLDAALTALDPRLEIQTVLTPVLTALADLGSTSTSRATSMWLVPYIRDVLTPLASVEVHARSAAPAAAVFFAGFGRDDEVRTWLAHGTHAEAPYWRDRVVLALLSREARREDLPAARAWLAELATEEGRDEGRALVARAFAASLPAAAAAELDAIGDDALRGKVARQLGTEPSLLAEPSGLYALVLALQDDPEALGSTLATLVDAHPDSALVAALARDLAPPARSGGSSAVTERLRAVDPDDLTAKSALELVRELHAMVTP